MRTPGFRSVAHSLVLVLLAAAVSAQTPCQNWSESFAPPPGTDARVNATLTFDTGSGPALYIGGSFTRAGSMAAQHIAMWDGEQWSQVGDGLGGVVTALGTFDDGTGRAMYAATYNPTSVKKWNGAVWADVGPEFSASGESGITTLVEFDDGTGPALYVCGWISQVGALPIPGLAKWDGAQWTAIATSIVPSYAIVMSLAVFNDGTGRALYAGGMFTSIAGVPAQYVARWNGSSWSPVPGFPAWARSLCVFDDGGGLALGAITDTGTGATWERVYRWNGSAWASLPMPSIPTSWWTYGQKLFAHDDGTGPALYAAVARPGNNATVVSYLVRWNGTGWTTLAQTGLVMTLGEDGRTTPAQLVAGGSYDDLGTDHCRNLAEWDGTTWSRIGPRGGQGLSRGMEPAGQVRALQGFDDGTGEALFAGSSLGFAGGQFVGPLATWNGQAWADLCPNAVLGHECTGLGIYHAATGDQLIASTSGPSGTGNGPLPGGIARWSNGTWIGLGSGLYNSQSGSAWGYARAIATYDSGGGPELYVGGYFHWAGGVPSQHVCRCNGLTWLPMSGGVSSPVRALATFDDGNGPKLYLGGEFTFAGGVPVAYIASWNGTNFAPVGGGVNDHVNCLRVWDDGTGPALYAGGYFTNAGGVPANGIARWNGTTWSALGSGVSSAAGVLALQPYDDGSGPALYAGGDFMQAGGVEALRLARWDGTSWSAVGSGMNHTVWSLGVADLGSGPSLYIGGTFDRAGGTPSAHIAEWSGCHDQLTRLCFGDGNAAPCPCANSGLALHGCENSASTGGARLSGSGSPALDTVVLHSTGTLPTATTIFIQGSQETAQPIAWGDGLRCTGGALLRLYLKIAQAGAAIAPGAGDASIRTRAAALGDALLPGSVRIYQAVYRDPSATFCAAPSGGGWNTTNAVRVVW